MKKLLTLLGSISMIGTAGATVVACDNGKSTEEAPVVSKQELLNLIEKATNLVAINPNPEAEARLKALIVDAQKVADNSEATQVEVDEATRTLQKGIADFQDATKTDYTALLATIKQATELRDNPKNPNEEEQEILTMAINEAQAVVDNPEATQVEADSAVAKLKEAIELFNKNTATDYSNLKEAIADAENSIKNPPNANAEVEKFQAEIDKARLVLENPEATQEEVDNAAVMLIAATAEFEMTPEIL